jgi:molecular chaperone GrpE
MLSSILDMDNDLSIAIKSVKSEEAKEGLSLITQKLDNFLKSQGVEIIQTETYDDELHEVISVMEIGESKVIDVISKGYSLNGKPFRYPKIILGK